MLHRRIACISLALCAACPADSTEAALPLAEELVLASGAASSADDPKDDAVSETDATLDRLTASYAFVGGEREHKSLLEAIESVVGEMSVFVRGIARSRLVDSNKVPTKVVIRRDGSNITVSFDDRTYTAVLGGPPVTVKGSTGDLLQLSYRLSGQRLVQDFRGERGGRVNTFFVDGNGHLRVDVQVHSPKLPKELRYRLSFKQA